MFDEDGNQITKNYEENVQKGQTLEVAIALTLVNTTDDVTIVFSDFDDHDTPRPSSCLALAGRILI